MSRASDKILPRLEMVRAVGAAQWKAFCPAHDDKHPSLSVTQVEDRVLVKCWAGCGHEAIVAALDLNPSDLFDDKGDFKPDPRIQRKAKAMRGLEAWRSRKLNEVCFLLRWLNRQTAASANLAAIDEDGAWNLLAFAYPLISMLEHDHDRLNSKDASHHLEVWQEHREAKRHAAA
jgi:hypothetical protein